MAQIIVTPGIHNGFNDAYFSKVEKKIVQYFSREWYLTKSFKYTVWTSEYRAMLIKPTEKYRNAFNLDRELIVIFSPYENFEPRSFDVVKKITDEAQEFRLEEICSVMISRDENVEDKIKMLFKTNKEFQVVVPISYSGIVSNIDDENYVFNLFRKNFYSRDLFEFDSPLRTDLYFFGRSDTVQDLVSRHLSHENSGLFGLRKTGKTSLLYGVKRLLKKKNSLAVIIDCELIYLKRWNMALFSIIRQICSENSIKVNTDESRYAEDRTSDAFLADIEYICRKARVKSVLLIFDEVEQITFDVSVSEYWKGGNDFLKFWHILRGLFQKEGSKFTYLIAGTNPMCVEKSTVCGVDNPIYNQIPSNCFIPNFSFNEVKDMVTKLGSFMGMNFEESVIGNMTQDYGGHPFLIRNLCSSINKLCTTERPITVNRALYVKGKEEFEKVRGGEYSEMILEVLNRYYPDEFVMLTSLSLGDIEFFKEFAESSPAYTSHLFGYGILEEGGGHFEIKIDMLKRYLQQKNKYKKLYQSNEEKQHEISTRRNVIEPKLRKIVRNQLRAVLGASKAKEEVLSLYTHEVRRRYLSLPYNDLFNPNKVNIYFDQLRQLICKHWASCFANVFETDVEKFKSHMVLINCCRKGDAHASEITDATMESFRGSMSWLEHIVENFDD